MFYSQELRLGLNSKVDSGIKMMNLPKSTTIVIR